MRTNDQAPVDARLGIGPPWQRTDRQRRIGAVGTVSRIVLGVVFVGSVVWGEWTKGVHPASWVLGLLGLPALLLAWQWVRARRTTAQFRATGPLGFALNCGIFFAFYLTPFYAPALAFTSDAALLFYGSSMLLAAARGYAGCEVLAISNWLLRRDDQVGCVVFAPIDHLESQRGRR